MNATQVFYEGKVQGVGFRFTVKSLARGFDVTGTVCNLSDGRVELKVAGDRDEVADFLSAIRESALAGHITAEHKNTIAVTSPFKGFQIES